MKITGGWAALRRDLEGTIERLFALPPEDNVEFDSLLRPDELDRLGYLRNFPHLTCLMCAIDEADLPAFAAGRRLDSGYAPPATRLGLLPATCYKVYLDLEGQTLPGPVRVGCVARCFRHEDKPLDRYRGYNFTMKEIVCLGSAEDARAHAEDGVARIERLMAALAVPFAFEAATDPFFDASSSVAVLSKAAPTKREVVVAGRAIASINLHRNYFGAKFGIRIGPAPVHTSCVAFGLERWIAMFQERFESPDAVRERLASLDAQPAPTESAFA
ncbi:aminoacyl--tRNA ligase-related protein [Salinarimonas sp. NSM]|uniref:aminoacyl--tRNA ligase-related protein n=1 Tax=Salinarimonas sp. NSM TaxID=3458003 RepID=UPI004036E4BD